MCCSCLACASSAILPPLSPVITTQAAMVNAFLFPALRHPPTVSPSFSFSHQANYISVTIETCLLNALPTPLSPTGFFFVTSLFSASTCLLFHSSVLLVIHLFPLFHSCYCLPSRCSVFRGWYFVFVPKRWELNMSHRFSLHRVRTIVAAPCYI